MTTSLQESIRGRLTLPSDPGWDEARRMWNLSVDLRPAAIADVASPQDVQEVVRLAARDGLRVAPQSTGHGSEALGPLDDTVLLKTSGLRGVVIRPEARTVRVGAGVLAGEAAAAAGKHGLPPGPRPPPASGCASARTPSPTCSGRFAAAAGASRSSPRSSSRRIRSARSRRG